MATPLFSHRFSAICILLGVAIIGVGIFLAIQVQQRKTWPETQAEIVENGWSESGDSVGIRLKVGYEVDGRQCETTFFVEDWANEHEQQLQLGPISYAPETIPKKYKRGERIRIYYDPDNVENAVLTPGDHWMNAYAVLFGLVLVAFGSLSPIHSLLMWRADRLLKTAEHQMQEFMANIEAAEQVLDELREKDPEAYQVCRARHQQLIDQFEMLFGDYKTIADEVRGDRPLKEPTSDQ